MRVIAVDAHPVAQPDYVAELGLLDGLDELLRRADVVAVAVPITAATRGMLSPERLALLKPGAYLLVLSRGGIVDEPALARMLRDGPLAGAGLDVTSVEPLPADSELWDTPNILISPHSSPVSARTNELSPPSCAATWPTTWPANRSTTSSTRSSGTEAGLLRVGQGHQGRHPPRTESTRTGRGRPRP